MASPKRLAVVISSTRPTRINPFIATYVADVFKSASQDTATIELLDLESLNLPLYNEPKVPGELPVEDPTPHYKYEYTRAWSVLVRKYDAFVFVTPQYNWSVPASLKNALDYVFHEWHGKPAGIVSYGHRGGVKSAAHLRQILEGLRMRPVAEPDVALKLVKAETPEAAKKAMKELWEKEGAGEQLRALLEKLIELLK